MTCTTHLGVWDGEVHLCCHVLHGNQFAAQVVAPSELLLQRIHARHRVRQACRTASKGFFFSEVRSEPRDEGGSPSLHALTPGATATGCPPVTADCFALSDWSACWMEGLPSWTLVLLATRSGCGVRAAVCRWWHGADEQMGWAAAQQGWLCRVSCLGLSRGGAARQQKQERSTSIAYFSYLLRQRTLCANHACNTTKPTMLRTCASRLSIRLRISCCWKGDSFECFRPPAGERGV